MNAKDIVRLEYGDSKNFMTPEVIKYGKISKNLAYELSFGIGLCREDLYGVSVVELLDDGTTRRRTDLSKVLNSLKEALDYIEELKE